MADRFDAYITLLECLKKMEATLLGMKQMREYVGRGPGREMLDFPDRRSRFSDHRNQAQADPVNPAELFIAKAESHSELIDLFWSRRYQPKSPIR